MPTTRPAWKPSPACSSRRWDERTQLRNIGPKSAAWLRQVGLRSRDDLVAIGAVGAFVKVKRAGFKPSLNLLYSLEGALLDCHWQELSEPQRDALVQDHEARIAAHPLKARPGVGPGA